MVTLLLFALLCLLQVPKIVAGRAERLERTVARSLGASDLIFSDFRTARNLVFFRTRSLAPSTATTVPFEKKEAAQLPRGAYVLIDKEMIEFMTRSYKYERPTFVEQPPASWKQVWVQGSATLYRIPGEGGAP